MGLLPTYGGSVQVSGGDTSKHQVAALVAAVDANITNHGANVMITAAKSNTGAVLVGDSKITTSRFGRELAAGESVTFASGNNLNTVSTLDKYTLQTVGADKYEVMIIVT